ncbi:hypothetical protein [Bradyrhizobium sp. USDA 10063]
MSIYSEPGFVMAREYSTLRLGAIGEIMTADRHGPDALQDVRGRVIEQRLESLYGRRAAVEDPFFGCSLSGALPAALRGEGAQ